MHIHTYIHKHIHTHTHTQAYTYSGAHMSGVGPLSVVWRGLTFMDPKYNTSFMSPFGSFES